MEISKEWGGRRRLAFFKAASTAVSTPFTAAAEWEHFEKRMESERDAWCGILPRESSPKFYLTRFLEVGQETTKSEAYCVPRLSQVPLIPESNPLLVKKWGDVKSFSFPSPIWELLCNYQLLGNNNPYYYIKAQEIRVTKKGISQTLWAWIFFWWLPTIYHSEERSMEANFSSLTFGEEFTR